MTKDHLQIEYLRLPNMLRKSAFALVASLSIMGGVHAASHITQQSGKTIYYQHADNAVLVNNTKGQYVLTMVGVEPKTLLFEGDFKGADQISTEKFFDSWASYGFNHQMPTVAIIRQRKNKSLSFKLKDPQYNMVKKTIHYVAEPQEEIEVGQIGTNWGNVVVLFERTVGDAST